MRRRAVFLDLSGTLVEPILVERLDDLRLIDGGGEADAELSGSECDGCGAVDSVAER